MTLDRKVCAECGQPVSWLEERRFLFRCPTHGLRMWWQITHGPKEDGHG